MKVIELIAKLGMKYLQSPVYFEVGPVSYPVTSVKFERVGATDVVTLSNKRDDPLTNDHNSIESEGEKDKTNSSK